MPKQQKSVKQAKSEEKQKSPKHLKILAASDLHGSSDLAKKLAEKAEANKVDLVLLLGDINGRMQSKNLIAPFKKLNKPVLFVPGNWDTSFETAMIEAVYNARNLDGIYAKYDDVAFIGLGNPDFKLSIDEVKAFEKIKANFDKLYGKGDIRKKILVSHINAHNTKSEFSGFKGSTSLRKAVDYFQPDFLLQGHIHEAEGIEEKLGKTHIINVGRSGRILEI
jgi:Icc-related predicted phosphoesterase